MKFTVSVLIDSSLVENPPLNSLHLARQIIKDVRFHDGTSNETKELVSRIKKYRLNSSIPILEQAKVASAPVKCINFTINDNGAEFKESRLYFNQMTNPSSSEGAPEWMELKRKYLLERYLNDVLYAEYETSFTTFALIDADGYWFDESEQENSIEWMQLFERILDEHKDCHLVCLTCEAY